MVRAIHAGLGRWGTDWAKTIIPHVPNVEIVAWVDTSPEMLARAQADLGVDPRRSFASVTDAARAVEADLVIGTLRTEAHHPVVLEALGLGLNVIVEKPFASTMAQARDLVAAAEKAGRLLMVSQNYRYHPAPIAVAELIGGRRFGDVNLVSIDFRRHAPTQGYRSWDFPNPLIADMSIHHFDLMRMVLADDPKRVSCRTWNPAGSPFQHHPVGLVTVEFERGGIVSYRGSWMSSGKPTAWSGEWVMDCAEGEIRWTARDVFMGKVTPDRVTLRPIGGPEELLPLTGPEFLDRKGTLNAIARAIETGAEPPRFSSGRDNLVSFALTMGAIASAERGGDWVEIAEVLA